MVGISLEQITETAERFYKALKTTPKISGQVNERRFESHDYINLIFKEGTASKLKCKGKVYDYNVLSAEIYEAKPIIEQVKEIIEKRGNPVAVRYEGVNDFEKYNIKTKDSYGPLKGCHDGITLLMPWEQAKEIIGL